MAVRSEVIKRISRWVFAPLICFFLSATVAHGAVAAPVLQETKWRTGELEIKWTGAHIGYIMVLYAATYDSESAYEPIDSWMIEDESGTHVVKAFENGQSVWYYVRQMDPATLEYTSSNALKQTPPITAYIINWPDMLNDLNQVINNAMKPSDQALDDLNKAIDDLKNAVGAGQSAGAGGAIQSGITGAQQGMSQPIVNDDGNGTYSGGSTGDKLPFPNQPSGSSGLIAPNPDSGTDTELTMRIPYGVDMNGNLLYMKLFTKEQMEKMKWLGLLRDIATAVIWIMFGMWLVQRFTPQMKV